MNTTQNPPTADNATFYIKGRGWHGKGMISGDGFIVLAGSTANDASPCFLRDKYYYPIRKALEESGVIVDGRFLKDYIFKSAAQAGCVIAAACIQAGRKWHTAPDENGKVRSFAECHPKATVYNASSASPAAIDRTTYTSESMREGRLWHIEYRGQAVSRFAMAVAW